MPYPQNTFTNYFVSYDDEIASGVHHKGLIQDGRVDIIIIDIDNLILTESGIEGNNVVSCYIILSIYLHIYIKKGAAESVME